MAFSKQAFYEGAALHSLIRTNVNVKVHYANPFYIVNDVVAVLFRYSTKNRSPWQFQFSILDHALLETESNKSKVVVGLICGADGIVALSYEKYAELKKSSDVSISISCYRNHGEHYEISGPNGVLDGKISPSTWQKIL